MSELSLTPIQSVHELNCPNCSAPIYRLFPHKSEVIRGGFWLRDGDTIPGLHHLLSDTQKIPNGFDYELLIGSQSCCGEDYYVVKCKFINANFTEDTVIIHFFEDAIYEGDEKNFVVNYQGTSPLVPKQWVVSEVPNPQGVIHSHLFGPFKLTEEIESPHGVAACCGSFRDSDCAKKSAAMLLTIWDEARQLVGVKNELYYWALAISNDKSMREIRVKSVSSDPEKVSEIIEQSYPGITVVDYVSITQKQITEPRPIFVISKTGWLDLNWEIFGKKDNGQSHGDNSPF